LTDDQALDLACAFVDIEYFGITEITFNRILIGEAITTKDLDGIVSVLIGSFAAKELGDGGLA